MSNQNCVQTSALSLVLIVRLSLFGLWFPVVISTVLRAFC